MRRLTTISPVPLSQLIFVVTTSNSQLTSIPAHDDPTDISAESEQLLERELEELLRGVDDSGYPLCEWKIDDTCAACLFAGYRRTCTKALTAREINWTNIADIMAIIGVFAPTMPTIRMHTFFWSDN